MSLWRRINSPVGRLSLGLVALVASLFLVADMLFSAIPSQFDRDREIRQRLAESLAIQIAALIQANDVRTLGDTMKKVVIRNKDVHSIAVRQVNGAILTQYGDHDRFWEHIDSKRSTINNLKVPIHSDSRLWGDIEISFMPSGPARLADWVMQPQVMLLAFIILGSLPLFYFYLQRAMQYLDPRAAIPDRVRKAFDTLVDPVLILETEGKIVLANKAFRDIYPKDQTELHGRKASELPWVRQALMRRGSGPAPWERVLRDKLEIEDEALTIPRPDKPPLEVLVSGAPIMDDFGKLRGCMVAFHDVTALHRSNEELRRAMAELEHSQEQIRQQNEELHRLATRDPLTGCLNRRAFFQSANELFDTAKALNEELCCIMTDIDHFKRFNDLYGHSVGDQVIQSVTRVLGNHIRQTDLLGRYGGEEFCIILPGATLEQARTIAERMRQSIEESASSSIRTTRIECITSSFGVSSLSDGAANLALLIDQADDALYTAKEAGRNQVSAWHRSST